MRKCKSDKCAKCRKCVVHKMRKFAAQNIFQMQILQFRFSALCTNFQMQISVFVCKVFFISVLTFFKYETFF